MGIQVGQIRPGYFADLLLVDLAIRSHSLTILQDKTRLPAIMKDGAFHKPPRPSAVREDGESRASARKIARERLNDRQRRQWRGPGAKHPRPQTAGLETMLHGQRKFIVAEAAFRDRSAG